MNKRKFKNNKAEKNKFLRIISLFIFLIIIFMTIKFYMQQKWTHRLIVSVQSENDKEVVELLDKDFLGFPYDVNTKPYEPFPMCLFAECQESMPLVYACETGNYNVICALIDSGANVNIHLDGHFVPLEMLLLRFGYTENWKDAYRSAELLIDSGADVDYMTDDYLSLYELSSQMLPYDEVYSEEKEEVIFRIYSLLNERGERGAEFMEKCMEDAVKYDNYKIVNDILCRDETIVDMTTEEGDGLLFAVCREAKTDDWKNGYVKTADILVKAGIDLSRRNKHGETVYEYAKRLGVEDVAVMVKP